MDRMKCQELALVRMVKMGELEKRTNMAGITIWQSKPKKKEVKVRIGLPHMEIQQGFD